LRKKLNVIICLVVLSLLIFHGGVKAFEFDIKQVKPYLGISYNTYNLGEINNLANHYGSQEIKGGIGIQLGADYKFSELGKKAGLEFDFMSVDYKNIALKASNFGLLVKGSYQLSAIQSDLNMSLIGSEFAKKFWLSSGVGIYRSNVTDDEGDIDYKPFIGPGFKLGLKGAHSVSDNFKLGGQINYRYSNVHSERDFNFNGLEVSFQAGYEF